MIDRWGYMRTDLRGGSLRWRVMEGDEELLPPHSPRGFPEFLDPNG